MAEGRFTIVILAAQREGRLDPLAAAAGVSHKCLVPIGGRPLLAHVLAAFEGLEGIEGVRISVEPGASEALSPIALASGLPVTFTRSGETIPDSIYAAAEGCEGPVVLTTADNVLLTPAAVRAVAARLARGDDGVAAFARKEDVLSAHPEGQRRFYRFRDGQFSNCNLYGFSRRGLELTETFREGGQFAKNPMRIARAFGFINLIFIRLGLVTLERATKRLGRRFGVRVSAVVLADGAHAIDVDNARTYGIAAALLDRRAA
jgi:GTP:adenosylcobinamide-phosphate guanylyltransferase